MQPPAAAKRAPDPDRDASDASELRIAGTAALDTALAAGDRYDRVVLDQPLDELADPAGVLREISSLLAPHGALIVSAANAMSASARLAALRGGSPPRGLTKAALVALVEEAGLLVASLARERDAAPLDGAIGVPQDVHRWLMDDEEARTTTFSARAVVADEPGQLAAAHAAAEEHRRRIAELEAELRAARERETALRDVFLDRHDDVVRLEARVAELEGSPPAPSADTDALRSELTAAYDHIHWMESRRIWRAGRLVWRLKGLLRR